MDNMQVSERIKVRDIFASLKDIFSKSEANENQEELEHKLKEIYKVQAEIRATEEIAALEKDIQTHTTSKKSTKNKNTSKISTKRVNLEKEKGIEEVILDQENSLDR